MMCQYTTIDPRFGKNEVMTIKEMMIRYRTMGYDINKNGSKMTANQILEDIYEQGAICVHKKKW